MERRVGDGVVAGRPVVREPSTVGGRRELPVDGILPGRRRSAFGRGRRDEGVRGGHERELGREEQGVQEQGAEATGEAEGRGRECGFFVVQLGEY